MTLTSLHAALARVEHHIANSPNSAAMGYRIEKVAEPVTVEAEAA